VKTPALKAAAATLAAVALVVTLNGTGPTRQHEALTLSAPVGAAVMMPALDTATATPESLASARVPPVAVFGDSLTHHGSRPLLEARPRWHIDAVRGRHAVAYPRLFRAFQRAYGSPRRLVVALGTNEIGASRSFYHDVVSGLPDSTTVLFVSTYRDPAVHGADRAWTMARVAGWMHEVARSRPRTCVVPWRAQVMRRPELLRDGVHATPRGREVWARLVAETMTRCSSRS
jgi:hypothetical protein